MGIHVVTGAASGIGAAIAARMTRCGHTVLTVDQRDAQIEADLGTGVGRCRAIDQILAAAPAGLDGLSACAGVSGYARPIDLVPRVNFFGVTRIIEGLRPALHARKGAVLMVNSQSATMQPWNEPHQRSYVEALLADDEAAAVALAGEQSELEIYAAAKWALGRWMRRQMPSFAKHGVRINAVAPGFTHTRLTDKLLDDPALQAHLSAFVASIPLGFTAEPDDIADAAEFLLGARARFMTGAVVFVDGGHDALMRPDSF